MYKIIKRLLGGAVKTTDRQQMVSCLVYIGAVKDNGIHIVVPAWWQIILSSTLLGQTCGCQWGFIGIRKTDQEVNSQAMLKKRTIPLSDTPRNKIISCYRV